jgi:CBS domain containing-hemolysin-like protein
MFVIAQHLNAAAHLSGLSIGIDVLLLLVLLALSASFSASEAVLFSLTPLQLERAVASPNPFRRLAAQIMRRPKDALMTLLVSNTAVNVLFFAVSYVLFVHVAGLGGAWVTPVAGAGSVLVIVALGEVLPKVVGVGLADRLAPLSATVVRIAGVVARPLGRVLDLVLVEPLSRIMRPESGRPAAAASALSRVELRTLLEMSRRGGTLLPLEDTFLRAVIDLGHVRVRDVMVPRVEMTAYDVRGTPDGLRDLMRATRYKKIPVFDGTRDNIVGLVYAKVLFFNPDKTLRELVQPVRFVPELATCEQLLVHFRSTKTQLAIAVDEYGGVAGLVTLEDVIEQIVGELHDPEDVPDEPDIQPLPDGAYDISGQLSVHYWVETFALPPRVERVATVGGLVMARLGRPAQAGDVVELGNIRLQVTRVRRRRIERLQLRLKDTTEGGPGAE